MILAEQQNRLSGSLRGCGGRCVQRLQLRSKNFLNTCPTIELFGSFFFGFYF